LTNWQSCSNHEKLINWLKSLIIQNFMRSMAPIQNLKRKSSEKSYLQKWDFQEKNGFNKKIFPEKHRIPLKVNSVFFYYSILYILENYSKYWRYFSVKKGSFSTSSSSALLFRCCLWHFSHSNKIFIFQLAIKYSLGYIFPWQVVFLSQGISQSTCKETKQ